MAKLIKNAVTTYIPASPGNPGSPYVPGRPARTVVESHTVCSVSYSSSPVTAETNESAAFGAPGTIYVSTVPDGYAGAPTSGFGQMTCETEKTTVYYPATAAIAAVPYSTPTAAQITVSLSQGWNSHARTVGMLDVASYIEYTVKLGTYGALMGVGPTGMEGLTIDQFQHGIMVDTSGVYVFESGAVTAQLAASNSPGMIIRILRLADGRIAYSAGGGVHFSATESDEHESLYVYGLLYSAYDEVSSAEFKVGSMIVEPAATMRGTGEVTMRPQVRAVLDGSGDLLVSFSTSVMMSGYGTVSASMTVAGQVDATLPGSGNLTGAVELGGRGSVTLLAMQALGSDVESQYLGFGSTTLPMFTVSGTEGQFVPAQPTAGYINLPFLTVWGEGSETDIGQGDIDLPLFLAQAAETEYGIGAVDLPYLFAFGSGGFIEADEMLLVSTGFVVSGNTMQYDLFLILNSEGHITSSLTLTREQALELLSILQQSDSFALAGAYGYELLSGLRGLSLQTSSLNDLADLPANGVVWVVNQETNASSQYEGYGFNSFFTRAGVAYGVAADGVYRLEGATDAGAQIDALANIGKLDMATTLQKMLPSVYLGASSTAPLKLEVDADGTVYTYETRSSEDGTFKQHRVDLGRGLKANMLGLTLKNKDGADFEIASVDLLTAAGTRRI